jgi:hypothetical protein
MLVYLCHRAFRVRTAGQRLRPQALDAFINCCLCHPDGAVLATIEAIRPSYLRGFALQRDHK